MQFIAQLKLDDANCHVIALGQEVKPVLNVPRQILFREILFAPQRLAFFLKPSNRFK